jgi:DNA-binding NarL/FixJ family response regulator
MDTKVKVMIVDDQALIRDGIASLMAIQPGLEVVGTAENGQEAVAFIEKQSPDVILMDIKMPVMDGIEAAKQILNRMPQIKIIMLTTLQDDEYVVKSLKNGACGYLLKDIPAADLAQAILMAKRGVFQLAPSVAGKLIDLNTRTQPNPNVQDDYTDRIAELTPREVDVLRLIATGATNREIANRLFLSEGTVKNIVSRIFQCLNIRDRVQAAVIAIHHGLG